MIAIALQSGSNGNCTYLEHEGTRLLFDAGLSAPKVEARLASIGVDVRTVSAVIISHDHADHVGSVASYQKRFGLPVYMTRGTFRAASAKFPLRDLANLVHFEAGDTLAFDHLSVRTLSTPHDAADGVAFVVEAGRKRLGILTDLGHVFDELERAVAELDAVLLESNYDPAMLARGSYPDFLKKRIRGEGGHLSNQEAADLLARAASERLRWVCLAHLSENNNSPALALDVHRRTLGERFPILVADRHSSSPVLKL